MIAPRFAVPVLALLAVTFVPVARHQYVGALEDDGRSTSRIPVLLGGLMPAYSGERRAWIAEAFDTSDWIERRYLADGREIALFVIRSYDAKRLYHHPELALIHGHDLRSEGVRPSQTDPPVPLHLLAGERGGVAAYALVHDDTFVSDPYRFQARIAGRMLVSRRPPMTLVLAHDLAAPASLRPESSPVARLVAEAAQAIRDQARDPSDSR